MKEEMSSVDVFAAVAELQFLLDAKLEKVYQHTPDEIRLRLQEFKTGKYDLIAEAGRRLHTSTRPRESPKLPPAFAMILRKYMMGGRITAIRQRGFDRIVDIEVVRAGEKTVLVVEIFAKGNVILLDGDRKIIMPLKAARMKDRDVLRGEAYEYPPSQLNPLTITEEELARLFAASDKDLVRTLATQTNIGGMYAEEVCLLAGIDKNRVAKSLAGSEVHLLLNGIRTLFKPLVEGNLRPHVVRAEGKDVDVLPLELNKYASFEKVYFATFNQALDAYFGARTATEIRAAATEKKAEKTGPLERRLRQQEEAIAKFDRDATEDVRRGEIIYADYQRVDEIIKVIGSARAKGYSWDDIRKTLKAARTAGNAAASAIQAVDPARGTVTVSLPDATVSLDIALTVPQNAQAYYDRAKKVQAKKEGALKAIEATRKAMAKAQPGAAEASPKKPPAKPRKPRWYDRFRWFVTSDGFLVVAGRDADSNEEIVKKYMDRNDVFFHAQAHGAPITVIKAEGKAVTPEALAEVAQFAVSYSSVWKAGQFSGDCYWVRPEQVSKTPESGEYVAKGAFIVRGERNYVKDVPVRAAVGIRFDESGCYVIGGPVAAVKARAKYSLEIEPGELNQGDAAKKIYRHFLEHASPDDAKAIRQAASPDRVMVFMPPGETRIVP
ncbi:MAG TPA: ribosome rescue protein RqcH [Methanocella sp.]|nr:ribosome rescue protein RqcH [Methanocella sp.]